MCIRDSIEFSLDIELPEAGSTSDSATEENSSQDTVVANMASDSLGGQAPDEVPEVTEENTASSSPTSTIDNEESDCAKEFRAKYELNLGKKGQDNQNENNSKSDGGIWTLFLLGFGGGLLALLTPCVFPMIPLTVTFFTKGDGGKGSGWLQAALYGFFITLVYVPVSYTHLTLPTKA